MTDYDLVELKAEMLAQKTVLGYCLTAIARSAEDPAALLDSLEQLFVPRLRDASPAFALPKHRPHFEKTAIGALAALIAAAKQNVSGPKPN